jgi:uncharacterized surface protein with fasciclin (FAS1) repeats
MNRITRIIILFLIVIWSFSCTEPPQLEPGFEDQEQMTIYDYIAANDSNYSSFMSILKKGGIDKTLSAYNPDGIGYTLFLPDNHAVDQFINESEQFSSLNDLLNDLNYVSTLSRYHVVNMALNTNEFPFGALPEYTLSDDILTISFIIEPDTAYYKINNQAPVVKENIELSNGYIHIINRTLVPITFTSYQWLEQHTGYSIFKSAIDATGLNETININIKDDPDNLRPFTLLIEHDSVYNKKKIYSFDDLAKLISPGNTDYTNTLNPMYNFTAYHIVDANKFLSDFVDVATNYTTYSEIPLNINGLGLDIMINKGKEIFDTIIDPPDTTIIDWIGFYYDAGNVLTQSGAIHFIDQILKQHKPSRAIQTFEFYEESLLNEYRLEDGTYLIEDTSWLNYIKWSGADLFFIEEGDESTAWGDDYLFINGDFTVSYQIPKIVQGKYTAILGAEAYNGENAVVEIYIDGKNTGRLFNLATGGSSAYPFTRIEIGTIDFTRYDTHIIEIRSLIPGRFCWDYIRFEPLN